MDDVTKVSSPFEDIAKDKDKNRMVLVITVDTASMWWLKTDKKRQYRHFCYLWACAEMCQGSESMIPD